MWNCKWPIRSTTPPPLPPLGTSNLSFRRLYVLDVQHQLHFSWEFLQASGKSSSHLISFVFVSHFMKNFSAKYARYISDTLCHRPYAYGTCVCVCVGTSYEPWELQTWQSLLYILIATQCAPSCCCCLVDVAVVNADNVACNCLWLLATSIGDRTVRTMEQTDSAAARRVLNLIINLRFFAIFTTRFVYIWPDARLRYCCTIADPLAPSSLPPPHFGSCWSININWKGFIL